MICLIIFIQDLKGRWIQLFTVLGLFGCGIGFRLVHGDTVIFRELLETSVFVTLILVLTWLVLRLRNGNTKFIDAQIGLGDILMFYAVGTWFDPLGYALYFVSGIVLVLLVTLALLGVGKLKKEFPIPLAGLLAAYLIVFAPFYWLLQDQIWAWMLRMSL